VAALSTLCADRQTLRGVPRCNLPLVVPDGLRPASDQHVADGAADRGPLRRRLSSTARAPALHDEANLSADRQHHRLLRRLLPASLLRVLLLRVSIELSSRLYRSAAITNTKLEND